MRYFRTNLYIFRVLLVVAADLLCSALAALVAWHLCARPFAPAAYATASAASALLGFAALYYCDAYRLTRMGDARQTNRSLAAASLLASVVLLLGVWCMPVPPGSLRVLGCALALAVPLLFAERFVVRVLNARTARRVAILGTGDLAMSVALALAERGNMGFELAGFIAEQPDLVPEEFPVLGDVKQLDALIERCRIETLLVAVEDRGVAFAAHELLRAKLRGVRIESGLLFYERVTGRVYLRELPVSHVIFSEGFGLGRPSAAVKRAVDVLGAAVGLVLASPLLALALLAIRLDSRGPLFYRQTRVGCGGRTFALVKLRSMVHGAEAHSGPVWARGRSDSRITRVGRVLRRMRLDEIPQLWNVLRGDMSLVGPRPERPEFVELLSRELEYFGARCAVKPGLTGWAQVRHGYANDVDGAEEKLALDLFYMKHQSVLLDLWILWKTLRTVVLLQGI